MIKWGVVADDLTGANTAAALLTNSSFRTITTVDHRHISEFLEDKYDAIVVNAASRTLNGEDARERVRFCTKILYDYGIRHFSKRIDSTIRGNLGAETEGMLDALPEDTIACVVAAFPASGRIVVGNYQLVNGVPVHLTMAGADPVKPVRSSLMVDNFKNQTKLKIGCVSLNDITAGIENTIAAIQENIDHGKKIIIFDAITFNDIDIIAKAMSSFDRPWIAVDPGPYTQKGYELLNGKKKKKFNGKILIVAGSASSLTHEQMAFLHAQTDARIISIDIRRFIDSDEPIPEEKIIAKRVVGLSYLSDVIGFRVEGDSDMFININIEAAKRGIKPDDITRRITHGLARISSLILSMGIDNLKGIYLTGGDMTVAFCEECNVKALELKGEIQPHISYGFLVGGDSDNLPIVTKGGLIGAPDTVLTCIKYLLNQ
ncbi:four-carbon acid sugar kinase family protein [Pectinatus haikarae]|uniref:Uncharacterized protein YgbK (DUF1537 family) n=1 Tax=Pectinatus haikarae TaxID=349096 RepID=A0ABT9Y9U9_9FIRM|nr:four-carbon acid sugar kinase family protein [Pectinatus haikarae]MDQ0204618.1 uncharacterized protein YgbK (DUF1537 family) [Pectinatus haikarae]